MAPSVCLMPRSAYAAPVPVIMPYRAGFATMLDVNLRARETRRESVRLNRMEAKPSVHALRAIVLLVLFNAVHGPAIAQPANIPTTKDSERSIEEALEELHKLSANKAFYRARERIEPLLKKYPRDVAVHLAAARVYQQMGWTGRSIQEYERVHALAPFMSEPLVALSEMSLQNLDASQAMNYARKALVIEPSSKRAKLALVQGLIARGLLSEAQQTLTSFIAQYPHDAEIQYAAFRLYRDRGQNDKAMRHLDAAIKLNGNEVSWLVEKSELAKSMGDYRAARAQLEKVIALDPQSSDALTKLAVVLEYYFHDYNAAIARYQQLLQMDRDSVTALAGIERCRGKKNDLATIWKYRVREFFADLFKL